MTNWDEDSPGGLGARWTRDAADWDALVAERLIEAVGADVNDAGTALIAEARTGPAVLRLAAARPSLRRIMVVDPDRDLLNAARETASDVASPPLFFNGQGVQTLNFADDVFSVAICCGGVATEADALNALSELERVVVPGGTIALAALGTGSFGAIIELLRECAWSSGRDHAVNELDDRLSMAVSEAALVASAERLGLEVVTSGVESVSILFERGDAVADNALLAVEWWPAWGISSQDPGAVLDALSRRAAGWFGDDAIDDEASLVWLVARVGAPESIAVDDDDVVDATPASDVDDVESGDVEVLSIDVGDPDVLSNDALDMSDGDVVQVLESDVEEVVGYLDELDDDTANDDAGTTH